ncbi:MAG TPA: ATP-binding protein [Oligoflexus sp.]|uniref:ATP-binding protein n=1 Tax=Oligoflexus sp. TaxID=1971216 RepID=UPI002D805254|nr:ATP-binding protein [Oligoflexus sp.]HET9241138.1 ATP-binding protein [Oligoflexus sp.]
MGETAARRYEAMTATLYEPSLGTDAAKVESAAAGKRLELVIRQILSDEECGSEWERRRLVRIIERAMSLSEGKKLLKHILAPLEAEKKSLARLLDKQDPELVIEDGVAFAADEAVALKLLGIFLHLIRNAIDHGMESPEERKQSGKRSQGRIVIRSEIDAGALCMTVFDDGRGLDVKRLARIYEARRGRSPESDEDAAAIIFEAGISTKDKASEISGRGVGMDAVLSEVHALGGEISIRLGVMADATGHRPFEFLMTFPLPMGRVLPSWKAGA